MRGILAVANYIFKQSFRNRILNVLIAFAVLAIGFSLVVSELAQEEEIKMITDFGMFAIAIFAFFTLMLSITIQMFEETELKTLIVVLVKPIKRWEFMVGKYFGILATILMNMALMTAALMVILKLKGGNPFDVKFLLAVSGSFLSISIVTAVALLLTVVTTSVPSCVISLFFIYVLGHLTIHMKNLAEQIGNDLLIKITGIIYYILPNLELFNLKDKIYSYAPLFEPSYLLLVAGYTVLYSAASLVIASLIFERKEFF
jgi:ABC-type transport system involved in multi-copper enzyme maturation permease subunit